MTDHEDEQTIEAESKSMNAVGFALADRLNAEVTAFAKTCPTARHFAHQCTAQILGALTHVETMLLTLERMGAKIDPAMVERMREYGRRSVEVTCELKPFEDEQRGGA